MLFFFSAIQNPIPPTRAATGYTAIEKTNIFVKNEFSEPGESNANIDANRNMGHGNNDIIKSTL